MKSDSRQIASIWTATIEIPPEAALAQDTCADVCVVGAGIAGITTAYLLAIEGRSVVVVDKGSIGAGTTARTTAHLSNAVDDRYFEIERLHGKRGAQIAAASHTAAIARIEAIVAEEGIECDFERLDGYLFVPPGNSKEVLGRELQAAHRAGLRAVERVERAPIDFFDTGECLRFPRQAQFHPLKYLTGLARVIKREGGKIFSGTQASKIEGGFPARVETSGGPLITADAVVVATNTPINDIVAIHAMQIPYTSYVIAARVPRGSVAKALYWDTLDPYHYVRLHSFSSQDALAETGETKGYDILIVGGEDHKTGRGDDSDDRYARLEAWARERFPMIEEIESRWSGQVIEPVDGVAFIGRNPMDAPNVYIATGDSGMGITHGTIAGILLTDLIAGRECNWAPLYDPARVAINAAPDFALGNDNVVERFANYLTSGEVSSVDDVAPGTGALVRRGLKKIAIYRDEDGKLHERSAVCQHLGCLVAWNSADNTWDCPCHGSRYDRYGCLLTGPADSDLAPVD